MLIHAAQLRSKPPHERMKGRAFTGTLLYRFARVTS